MANERQKLFPRRAALLIRQLNTVRAPIHFRAFCGNGWEKHHCFRAGSIVPRDLDWQSLERLDGENPDPHSNLDS
jgi:hypothetical protein